MNLRNRKLVITIRTIYGLFMLFSGVTGFMALFSGLEGIPAEMLENTRFMINTGIFQMIKVTEVVAGLMLVVGFLPALAAIFLAPICIGVIVVNGMTAPEFIVMGFIISVFNAYLGYVYWDQYKALFTR